MKKNIFFLITAFFLSGCAKIVMPVGGPKDTTPPVVIKEFPENKSIHFNSKHIKLNFNEFVVLNNPNQNVLFSPPLSQDPEFSVINKSVIVKLPDTLQPSTTYNVVFSNCIKDFTEGNPIPYYSYVFSTGEYIDSFTVRGKLINAETLKPEPNCFVFLYQDDIDSLPKTSLPTYITKSLNDGLFRFDNIADGNYKIFALNDINHNLKFDLPNEDIGYLIETVKAFPMPVADTTKKTDTLKLVDTTVDSLQVSLVELQIFTEMDTVQKLQKYLNPQNGIYIFPYKTSFRTFEATVLKGASSFSYFEVISDTKDSVTWYMKQPVQDSITVQLTVDNRLIDTVMLLPYKSVKTGRVSKKETPVLTVSSINAENVFLPLTLIFPYPIKPNPEFEVYTVATKKSRNDTLVAKFSVPDQFTVALDLPFVLEEKVPYTILIRDSVFEGYNGLFNDSIRIGFTTKSEKDYGNLMMKYVVEDDHAQYIVSLIVKENQIIKHDIISRNTIVVYPHLTPGAYKIKVIKDSNKNGKWDTGHYSKKEQPEKIFYFEKPITIRGYWDVEETFELK